MRHYLYVNGPAVWVLSAQLFSFTYCMLGVVLFPQLAATLPALAACIFAFSSLGAACALWSEECY